MDEPPRKDPRGQRRQDRGRPRRFADPQGPEREWLEDLSPTAAHIVKVASELLVEEGFEAVTIERVAHRANVAPPTVRRLFVSKASLVQAVFDQTELAAYKELIERVSDRPPRDRVDAYLRNLQTLIRPVSGVVTSTVLAHGLRDPITREKIAADYEIARLNTMEDTGLTNSAEWGDGESWGLRELSSLIIAVIDGLSLQVAANPRDVDLNRTSALLADMVALLLQGRPASET